MIARSLLAATLLLAAGVAHAGSVRVQNQDSSAHTVELKCSGAKRTVTIKASTTSTVTFHSTLDACEIEGGTVEFPTETLEDGQKWRIQNGDAKAI